MWYNWVMKCISVSVNIWNKLLLYNNNTRDISLKWSHYRFSLLKDGIMLFCHMRVMAFIDWLTREKCFMMIRILPSIFHIFPSPPWILTCYILRSRQQHPVLLPTIRWDWHDSLVLIRREIKFYKMFANHNNVDFLPEDQVHFCLNSLSLTAWVQQFFFSSTS